MSVTLLVVLTVIEIVALVAVLAIYLILVTRRLQSVADNLGRLAFGVRAVETQVNLIGPGVDAVNQRLRVVNSVVPDLAAKAEELARR